MNLAENTSQQQSRHQPIHAVRFNQQRTTNFI